MQHAHSDIATVQPTSRTLVSCLIGNQKALKAYIRKSIPEPADVDDLFQKLLLKALKKADSENIDTPLAYGYKMLQHLIIDHVREVQKHPESLEFEPEGAEMDLDTLLEYDERVALYQQVISNMPEKRQEVFIRRRLRGESREEIALALGMAEEAVKKHISRAMDDLRTAVERHYAIKNCPPVRI